MRIETASIDEMIRIFKRSRNSELKEWRFRFLGMYDRYLCHNDSPEVETTHLNEKFILVRKDFYEKYKALQDEIKKRDWARYCDTRLEKEIFKFMLKQAKRRLICKFCDKSARWAYTYNDESDFMPVCHEHRGLARAELKKNHEKIKVKHISEITDVEKGAIAFKNYGAADEGAAWEAAHEVRQMEVEDLRKYCAWYDPSNPDVKSSYKLPHHRKSDGKAVWRAVYAAMAALFGARTPMRIPSADRKGVYNHLAKHYAHWEKEVPEFKRYNEFELGKTFPIEKPEETENSIRIPVDDCEVTATITIDADQGIQALYCGREKKIRTYIFSKDKGWTMSKAKAWVAEHKQKQEKYECECIECGHKMISGQHCAELKCPKCGGQMRRAERPGPGQKLKYEFKKIDEEKQIVGGIVYEPDMKDTQGDEATAEEIEKAMYSFMEKYADNAKRINVMHAGKRYFFPIIESFIPEQKIKKGGFDIKPGTWWMMVKITDKEIWKKIKNEELNAFSMEGRAREE